MKSGENGSSGFKEKRFKELKVLFVCVEVLQPSKPNGVMSSVVSLPNHTFTGQAYSSKRLISIVHIPLPETGFIPAYSTGTRADKPGGGGGGW